MNSAAIDVVGIGNAIVDVIAHAEERVSRRRRPRQGRDDPDRRRRAPRRSTAKMGPAIESSGGSAGNTMAGIASLGGTGGYIGKVRDDLLGRGVPPRHHRDRRAVRHAGRDRRARHRALPDPGDAGRAAHDGHLSRRLRRTRARGHRRRADRRRPGHLSRRLSVRPAAGAGGVPQRRRDRARAPDGRWR